MTSNQSGPYSGPSRGQGFSQVIAMRHVNHTLKPATIDNAKPRETAYALTDGGGLQIEVLPAGHYRQLTESSVSA